MKKKDNSRWLHVAISWGASVVILGALFKILHIGGSMANYMIGLGLGVEAALFFIMGFNPPQEEPAWERVYPELSPDYQGDLPKTSARTVAAPAGPSTTAALDKIFADAQVGPETLENLGKGLRSFNDKVSAINNISDASFAANEFTQKLKQASAKFDELGSVFERASQNLVSMSSQNANTEGYHKQVQQLTENLSALNVMYERELRESGAHLQSMSHFYEHLSSTMQNFNDSLEDSKSFKDEVNKLAKNLAALNSVYGNMLNAMNQPRM